MLDVNEEVDDIGDVIDDVDRVIANYNFDIISIIEIHGVGVRCCAVDEVTWTEHSEILYILVCELYKQCGFSDSLLSNLSNMELCRTVQNCPELPKTVRSKIHLHYEPVRVAE